MERQIFETHEDQIRKELELSQDEFRDGLFQLSNDTDLAIYWMMVGQVSEKKSPEYGQEFADRISRASFTGDLSALVLIEEEFGPGSLKVLSYMGLGDSEREREKIYRYVEEYFSTDDDTERQKLAENSPKKVEDMIVRQRIIDMVSLHNLREKLRKIEEK
jgi:hypothetical protein